MSPLHAWLRPGAFASGLLLTLSLPDIDAWPLAWIALVPLLVALEGRSPAEAARLGFAAGVVHAVTTIYWVVYTMKVYGEVPWLAGTLVMLLLAAYLAVFPAAWAAGLALVAGGKPAPLGPPSLLLAAPLWAALDWVQSWLLSGFPWMLLGYSQYRRIPLIQVADLGGVYAVSFLVVAGNVGLYALLGLLRGAPRRPAAALAGAALVLAAGSLAYGRSALARLDARVAAAGPPLPVGVAQGSIEQAVKWDPAFQEATLEIYRALTARLAAGGAEVVVWPETAVPAFFQRDPRVRPLVLEAARSAGVDLVFGAPSAETRPPPRAGGEPRQAYFNSAYVVGRTGAVKARYDKQHLVPFGEYVPLPGLLFFLNRLAQGIGDFEAGGEMPAVAVGGVRIGILICYEAIFPDLARRMAGGGAAALVNLTNDAWFGRTAAPWQHLAQAAFRAAELKLPLVRAANTGVSAFVGPDGRIEQTLGLFTRGALAGTIPRSSAPPGGTLYARVGDRFAQTCAAASAAALYLAVRRRRGSGEPAHAGVGREGVAR